MQVVDMTHKTNNEIIDYLMNQKGRVCGRIKRKQVDNVYQKVTTKYRFLKAFTFLIMGFSIASENKIKANNLSKIEAVSPVYEDALNPPIKSITQANDSLVELSGQVFEAESGEMLAGITVHLRGTSIITTTDHNGTFKIELPESKSKVVLVFSFIGLETKEVEVFKIRDFVEVKMNVDIVQLGEISIPWHKRLWWSITSPFRKG